MSCSLVGTMHYSPFSVYAFNDCIDRIFNAAPYPFRFNTATGKFVALESAWDLFCPYNVTVAFVFFCLLPIFFIYIFVYKAIFHPGDVQFSTLFVQLLIFVPPFALSSLYVVVALYRVDVAAYFNCIVEMKVRDTPIIRKSLIIPGSPREVLQIILKYTFKEVTFSNREEPEYVDKLAIALVMSSFFAVIYTPFYPISVFLVPYDYTSLILYDIFPMAGQRLVTKLIISCTAFILGFIVVEQLNRFTRMCLISIVPIVQTFRSKLSRVVEFDSPMFNEALRMYKFLCVVHNVAHEVSSRFAYVGYEFATLYGIVTLTGTVIGWKFLSTPAYLVLAVANGIQVVIAIHVLFQLAMTMDAVSEKILHNWITNSTRLPGIAKYNKRVLASLKPISFPVKHLGAIDQDFDRRLFTRIVMNAKDLFLVLMTLG